MVPGVSVWWWNMAVQTGRTPKKTKTFLTALAEGFSVTHACAAAKIGRSTAYEWRADDPEFAEAWDAAVDEGTERLEDEAYRRAYTGITEEHEHYAKGEMVGKTITTKYSDTLLIFLLKARRPLKYRDNVKAEHVHTGPNGGPIPITTIIVERPPDVEPIE